ncbi:mitotic spindle assembly checkpoint protein MAD2A [Teleopsis dalmanni]|uniref:mitotic spindle assembly checkpoint protein MAD2A n=1 Tax=Teleopsis dalmanni TaxID=139649 RepID=UPI000D32A701|nr:mitotic spindle assembly checkpoint protein MAD2A [Teleopsis dalmanni]
MATSQSNKITLKGSAQIIVEYLKYGINSILFQRGIYPAESFENAQQYGLTILMSTDPKIQEFLVNVLRQTEEWLAKDLIEKISMIITNAHTKEVLECWDFKMQLDATNVECEGGDATKIACTKDMKRIQNEIRDVMRQISATVSYLPLIEAICTFDVLIYINKTCDTPEKWKETDAAVIQNSQVVQLRSFSTGIHKVDTVVNYKMTT